MRLDIIAVSRLKKGPYADLVSEYSKRIRYTLNFHEIEARSAEEESKKILEFLSPSAVIIALDERGSAFKSLEFSKTIEDLQIKGQSHLQFVIGGADGISDEVRAKARILMSFGKQTWPHLLARVMLLEQIYRAQQILSGHPYHRE